MDIEVAVRVIYYLGEAVPVRRTVFVVLLLSCVYLHSSLTILVVHYIFDDILYSSFTFTQDC